MASTRNKNTRENYCLEQQQYKDMRNYPMYENSTYGSAYHTQMPGLGVNPGQIPWNQLSNNAVQIETYLYGIGSSNLVNPTPHTITPQLKSLTEMNVFKKETTYIPEPLVVEKFQRPWPSL
jgi:hypothetical protein